MHLSLDRSLPLLYLTRALAAVWLFLGAACSGEAGDPCVYVEDCKEGLRCTGPSEQTVCRARSAIGEACWTPDNDDCAPGLVCSVGVCVAPGTRASEESCSHNVDCASGLICNWSLSPYRCTPPALVDERCEHQTDCDPQLSCSQGLLGSGTCECGECSPGFLCGARGCIPPGSVATGERCLHNADCRSGLVCLWADKPYVCAPPRQLDEPCGHDTDCATGLSCNERAVCRTACQKSDECPGDQVCHFDGTCNAPRGLSEPCRLSTDCRDELWCDSKSRTCVPDLPLGSPCEVFDGDAPCQAPLSCVAPCLAQNSSFQGSCALRQPAGGPCTSCPLPEENASLCSEGACEADCQPGLVCQASTCQAATGSSP